MIDGKVYGYFLLGQNPAVGSAHGRLQRLGMANLDWLVVRDLAMIESATFWKDSPGGRDRRDRARAVPHRGVLLPRRLARGEGGHVHPDPADAAVAGEGGRAEGRPALGAVVLLPPRPDAQGAAGRTPPTPRDRPLQDLNWDYEVHGDEPSADVGARARSTATTSRPASSLNGYTGAEGRRLHVLRLLDLLRRLRGRRQPGRPAQAAQRAGRDGAGVGLGVAVRTGASSTTARPPTRRAGRGASARSTSGGTTEQGRVDRPRRAGLREDQAAVVRAGREGAVGPAALRGDDPFVMQADGKGWLYVPERAAGRAAADALRAARVAVRATRSTASRRNPTRKVYGRDDNPSNPSPPERARPRSSRTC